MVMIQETKMNKTDEEKILPPKGYKIWMSSLKKERMRGVMTIIKEDLAARVDKKRIVRGEEGRYLMIPMRH